MALPYWAYGMAVGIVAFLLVYLRERYGRRYSHRYDHTYDHRPHQTSNSNTTAADQKHKECVICFDRKVNTRLIPCEHELLCVKCLEIYLKYDKKCPICRTNIEGGKNIL